MATLAPAPPPPISNDEYGERRRSVARHVAETDLDAVVVWSRGGATLDHYGDVAYLTGHHSVFNTLVDAPAWSARGHAVAVVRADGACALVTDYLDDPDGRVAVDDVRVDIHVPRGVARALKDLEVGDRIGLVGRETLTLTAFSQLEDALGRQVRWTSVDELVAAERRVKSEAELAHMRYAGAVGAGWATATMEAVAEGRTEAEVVAEGLGFLVAHGGRPYDVAIASGPTSGHFYGSSGHPHWNTVRPLRGGELVHVDMWGPVLGYYTDLARSTVVGGRATDGQREVLEAAVTLIEHLAERATPGRTFSELFGAAVEWLAEHGFAAGQGGPGQAFADQFPCYGHCIGLTVEGPWILADEHTRLERGMVLAIEAVVGRPGVGAANHEVNVVVGDGTETLDGGCPSRWWT